MYIKIDYGFIDLKNHSWSGAISTLEKIEEAGKEDELMELLEEVFEYEIPTDTEVNDLLWFEDEYIFEQLDIKDEEDEEDEEEDEEEVEE